MIFAAYLTDYSGSSANTAFIWPPQLQTMKFKIKTNACYCTFPEMEVACVQYAKIPHTEIQARWFLLDKKKKKNKKLVCEAICLCGGTMQLHFPVTPIPSLYEHTRSQMKFCCLTDSSRKSLLSAPDRTIDIVPWNTQIICLTECVLSLSPWASMTDSFNCLANLS